MQTGALFGSLPEPRKWQVEALESWKKNRHSGIVEVVTGGGKTLFAFLAIKEWLSQNPVDPCVVVVVPTTALQDQWLIGLTGDCSVSRSDISVWPEDDDVHRTFHLLVVNSARKMSSRIAQRRGSLMLVADECHRYGSAENSKAIRIQSVASLGLTATAEREYDDGLYLHVIPSLGPIIHRYTLRDALEDGVVSPFALTNVETDLDTEEKAEYDKLTKSLSIAISHGEDDRIKSIAMRRSLVTKRAKSRIPTTVAIFEMDASSKTLIFHEDIESADLITAILRDRSHRVRAYHSKIGAEMRRDNLRMFRDGQLDALVACRALDEGLDVPGAERAVISASTASTRQRIQRIGRVLRKAVGKELAQVYTIFATESEARNLGAEESELEGVASISWLEVSRS